MGHSHAIYNATDKPVQWMNINVSAMKDTYDAFNLNDGRVDVPLDPIPAVHDHAARPRTPAARDRDERRQRDRAIPPRAGPHVFSAPGLTWITWCCPPALPSARTCITSGRGLLRHEGRGDVTVGGGGRGAAAETAPIKEGDAIPIQLGEIHSLANTGSEPLEFMIIGVSRDSSHKIDTVDVQDVSRK